MRSELTLPEGGLRGQGVELFSCHETFFLVLKHLCFLEPVHEFHAGSRALRCVEGCEPQHRTGDSLDG